MNICFDVKYQAEVYEKVLLTDRFLKGQGIIKYNSIDFLNYNNPFFDLINLINKRVIHTQKVIDFVERYGFLKSSDNGECYQSFLDEASEIVDLWKKNEQIQNADIVGLRQWINVDRFLLDKSLTVMNILENEQFSSEAFFKEPVKEVERNIKTYQYVGMRYIARKISSKIEGLIIYNEKITTILKEDLYSEKIKLKQPVLQPPNLITALYLYFYSLLQEGTRICPVCFGINMRKSNAKTCSNVCAETFKKRNQKIKGGE